MIFNSNNTQKLVLVVIDIAKARNDVLVQLSISIRKKFKVAKKMKDYQDFTAYLKSF